MGRSQRGRNGSQRGVATHYTLKGMAPALLGRGRAIPIRVEGRARLRGIASGPSEGVAVGGPLSPELYRCGEKYKSESDL